MLAKERINELDISSKEYKIRLEKLRSEVEVLNKDIERHENILHQIEIERRTLVTLNNIYKDPYPDTEIEINLIRKEKKGKKATKAPMDPATAEAEQALELITKIFQ